MTVPRMHDDEVDVDDALVRRLLAAQLPHLADLPRSPATTWGTDHAIYRLGDDLSVRLPKIGWAARQGEKEDRWLPVLAPQLPVEVPVPVFVGEPAEGYPFRWYVSPWLEGREPDTGWPGRPVPTGASTSPRSCWRCSGSTPLARPALGPVERGGPLDAADAVTRERAGELRDEVDVDALLEAWDAGVRAAAVERAGYVGPRRPVRRQPAGPRRPSPTASSTGDR